MEKNNKSNILLPILLVLLAVGGIIYANSKRAESSSNTSTGATPTITVTPTATGTPTPMVSPTPAQDTSSGETKTITIAMEAGNFYFDPKEINVNKGDKVVINLINVEGFHDFVLDEFNVRSKRLQANESETLEFTADKTGTFEFYCSVGEHRKMGMVGNLIVK